MRVHMCAYVCMCVHTSAYADVCADFDTLHPNTSELTAQKSSFGPNMGVLGLKLGVVLFI